MNNKVIIIIVLLIIVLGGGYFASKSMMKPAPAPEQAVQPTTVMDASPTAAVMSPENGQKITVSGDEFAFMPDTITIKKGQPATITFKNTGKYPHNFTIAELNVQTKTIQPGGEDTVTFTPDKAGSFSYICTIPGHADRGMKGTLTVE